MYIILKEVDHSPNSRPLQGSSSPVVHFELEKAKTELRRLVRMHPGNRYYLFKDIGSMKAEIELNLIANGVMEPSEKD